MSTLVRLFTNYNKKVYNKPVRVPAKLMERFAQVEHILSKAQISLEDYALTTFTDRIRIAQKVGHLPVYVFISDNSLKNYVKRLEAGCEVTKKKDAGVDEYWSKENEIWIIEQETMIANYIMRSILNEDRMPSDEEIVKAFNIPEWYLADHRRPLEEVQRRMAWYHNVDVGTYEQIAAAYLAKKEEQQRYWDSDEYYQLCLRLNRHKDYYKRTGRKLV